MDRAEGLRWLSKPVYILNDTFLCKVENVHSKHSDGPFLRFFNLQVKAPVWTRDMILYYSGHASVLNTWQSCLWNGSLKESSQNPWTPWSFFYCYWSCPSLLGKLPRRSLLGIAAQTHSETAKEEVLKPSILGWDREMGRWGLSTVGWTGGGGCCARGLDHNATGVPSLL